VRVLISAAELVEVVGCSPDLNRRRLGHVERATVAALRMADRDVQGWGALVLLYALPKNISRSLTASRAPAPGRRTRPSTTSKRPSNAR
jgi:hypothetical protein